MTILTRLAMSLAGAVFLACNLASAQISTPHTENAELPPDLAALLAGRLQWSVSTTVKAGYGYKDNLLLSFIDEERSAFARGGVELLLLRIPTGSFDYSFFAEAERTHYFSGRGLDHDAKVWVQTEPGYRVGETWKFSLPVTGYYYDQVFDVSATEVKRDTARLLVRGLMIAPTVRWDFHPSWWMEAQAIGHRKRYDDGANDGRIGEGALTLGWTRDWLEVRLSGAQRWRDFDRRAQYTASGRERFGTALKIAEREGEARVSITWDKAGHWRSKTRGNILRYQDNGSGFFDYRERKVAQELEWRIDPWRVRVGANASRLDFAVQKVGFGIEPPARLKDEFGADLQIDRKLDKQWTVFGSYQWERSRSNDPMASYAANEGLLGMRWNWDK